MDFSGELTLVIMSLVFHDPVKCKEENDAFFVTKVYFRTYLEIVIVKLKVVPTV